MPVAMREVPERFAHQPALDGLRGLAVIAVLVFHQNFTQGWGRGGFLGVDVFFVLSGFLITSLLLIDHARTGRVVSLQFWARRARRLFPALLVVLLLAAAYAAFVAKPWELKDIRSTGLATLFYVNNFWQMPASHRYGPLVINHTWSLSIEEQFYFVWPVLLALLVRVTRGRTLWILAILAAISAASVGFMARFYDSTDVWRSYLGTETRAHSLLVGAALAVAMLGWKGPARRAGRVALEIAGVAALVFVFVLVCVCDFDHSAWLYHGGYLLVALAAATLIAAAVQSTSPLLRKVLSVRPLVAAGLISYGLYLFHLPIYTWLTADRVGISGIPLFALRTAVTVTVAVVSYFVVERPIRRGALSWPRLRIVAPIATMSVVAIMIVATLGSEPAPLSAITGFFYSNLATTAPAGSTRVLVAGDSLAFSLSQSLGGSYTGSGIVGTTVSVADCGIGAGSVVIGNAAHAVPDCLTWPSVFKNAVDSFDPDFSVLLLGPTAIQDHAVNGVTVRVGTSEFTTYMLRQLGQARKILTANGTRLVLLTTPCMYPPNAPAVTIARNRQRVDALNSVLRQFAVEHTNSVEVADFAGYACPNGAPLAVVDGSPARQPNGIVFARAGAIGSWKWLSGTSVIGERVRSKR